MPPTVLQQKTPATAYTIYNNRPIRYIGSHHTATPSDPAPVNGSSWHRLITRTIDPSDRNFTIIKHAVPTAYAAHTILKSDKWRPSYFVRCPDGRVSDANYCGLQYEVVYNPDTPLFQTPLPQQLNSWRWQLEQDYILFGSMPIIGHGDVQSDKWPTEPHPGLPVLAHALNLSSPVGDDHSRYLLYPPPPDEGDDVDPISDADLKDYLEGYGIGVNMDTALIKRAALAYRRGERRGPAISGEYTHAPTNHTRQDFTAATADYDPATGGVSWVELNLERAKENDNG